VTRLSGAGRGEFRDDRSKKMGRRLVDSKYRMPLQAQDRPLDYSIDHCTAGKHPQAKFAACRMVTE
jgi:hypothetical protein